MQIAFLMIIAAVGAIYALVTKKFRIGLGLVIIILSLVLQIPNMVSGFWVDLFSAFSLILFALAVFVMVYEKKKETKGIEENPVEEKENGYDGRGDEFKK